MSKVLSVMVLRLNIAPEFPIFDLILNCNIHSALFIVDVNVTVVYA